jgi:hypothetical protein
MKLVSINSIALCLGILLSHNVYAAKGGNSAGNSELEARIAALEAMVIDLQGQIDANKADIASNAANIATNTSGIAAHEAKHISLSRVPTFTSGVAMVQLQKAVTPEIMIALPVPGLEISSLDTTNRGNQV